MMHRGLDIRPGRIGDLDTLARFAVAMAQEVEGKHLDPAVVRAGTEAMLRSKGKGFFRVAEAGDQIVGSLMVTYEWSDWNNKNQWWIQSVYVAPSWRRKGVYRALYEDLVKEAKDRSDVSNIYLYAHKDNVTAQKTYAALGMSLSKYLMYELVLRE